MISLLQNPSLSQVYNLCQDPSCLQLPKTVIEIGKLLVLPAQVADLRQIEVLFGGERIYILPNIYSKLQKNPKNATQLPAIILNNPMEIQKIANRTKSAFRINGVTYVYE